MSSPSSSAPSSGGSSLLGVRRVFSLLRVIAGEGGSGLRLSTIAERTGMHVASTHRMLRALAQERAVVYDPYTRHYHIGYDFLQQEEETLDQRLRICFQPVLQRMADLTHDSVFLSTRHGTDALYIASVRGQYPGDWLPLDVGGRRPLGAGPAGIVLLAALPAREAARIIDENIARYPRYNVATTHQVRAMLRAYQKTGQAFASDNIETGLSGLALPLQNVRGEVVAALSVISTNERLTDARRQQILGWARLEIARTATVG